VLKHSSTRAVDWSTDGGVRTTGFVSGRFLPDGQEHGMGYVLGIELGTTNSAMAVVNDYGRPEILTNREGGRVTPSVPAVE
jgi:hypothetical protein